MDKPWARAMRRRLETGGRNDIRSKRQNNQSNIHGRTMPSFWTGGWFTMDYLEQEKRKNMN
jgi:hypothetical protein